MQAVRGRIVRFNNGTRASHRSTIVRQRVVVREIALNSERIVGPINLFAISAGSARERGSYRLYASSENKYRHKESDPDGHPSRKVGPGKGIQGMRQSGDTSGSEDYRETRVLILAT